MSDNNSNDLPLSWKKMRAVSTALASILIPLVIAVVGYKVNTAIQGDELGLDYVELAVSVLREPPRKETENLRKWAIDIINNYAAIKLSEEAKTELRQEPLPEKATSATSAQNYTVPTEPRDISVVVVTDSEFASLEEAVRYMRQPGARASYHYLIGTDGKVIDMIPEDYIAWHAGRSKWKDMINLNQYSIGIGMIHIASKDGSNWRGLPPDHPAMGPNYPQEQLEALTSLLVGIASSYQIDPEDIITKQQAAPDRRATDLTGQKMKDIRKTVAEHLLNPPIL